MKQVKVNPILKRSVGQVRDEKLNVFFSHDEWVEVNEEEWKRLKEATFKYGDLRVSLYVAEGEGEFGEVKEVVKPKAEPQPVEDDIFWEEDVVAEEE